MNVIIETLFEAADGPCHYFLDIASLRKKNPIRIEVERIISQPSDAEEDKRFYVEYNLHYQNPLCAPTHRNHELPIEFREETEKAQLTLPFQVDYFIYVCND